MKNTKAAELMKGRTTTQLIDDLILTGKQMDATRDAEKRTNLATVRGWIMDELEERNPEAYDAWIESYDEDEGPAEVLRGSLKNKPSRGG